VHQRKTAAAVPIKKGWWAIKQIVICYEMSQKNYQAIL
jgi:hypothetical protein